MGKAGDYRICPKCGKDIKVDATLCGYCWTKSPPSSRAAEIQAAHDREFQRLVEELSRIGRDVRVIRYPGGRKEQVGASGFLRSGDGGEVNERAAVIGRRLAVIGGHDLMLRAHCELQSILGAEAARELSKAWGSIGYWGSHDQTYQRPLPVPKTKSQNLRALEERLSCDLTFAKVTVQRDGANLNHWIPPLSKEEVQAAVEAAKSICQPSSDEESQENVNHINEKSLPPQQSLGGEAQSRIMSRAIGVLFDIDGLGGPSSYGTPCWRILMKYLDLREMPGVLFYQGDLDIEASQRPYCFCIAISELPELTGGRGCEYFVKKMSAASDPGLFPPGRRFVEGNVTSSLVGSGRVDVDGRFRMSSQLGDLGDLRLVRGGREFGWRVLPDVDLIALFALTYLAKTGGEGIPLGDESKQLCESVLRDTGQRDTIAALRAAGLPADRLKNTCDRLVQQVWPDSPQPQPESTTPSHVRTQTQEKKWWEIWK